MSKRSILQALPLALCSQEDGVPEWVQLTPQGPRLPSRDGRTWLLSDPDAVVRAYVDGVAAGIEAPVDFEHATHVKGEAGERADAIGWVKEIANRDGALWGRIDWTDTGRAAIATAGGEHEGHGGSEDEAAHGGFPAGRRKPHHSAPVSGVACRWSRCFAA